MRWRWRWQTTPTPLNQTKTQRQSLSWITTSALALTPTCVSTSTRHERKTPTNLTAGQQCSLSDHFSVSGGWSFNYKLINYVSNSFTVRHGPLQFLHTYFGFLCFFMEIWAKVWKNALITQYWRILQKNFLDPDPVVDDCQNLIIFKQCRRYLYFWMPLCFCLNMSIFWWHLNATLVSKGWKI